jgi:hypothetical protein
MRFYYLVIFSLLSSAALATQVVIESPCSNVRLLDTQVAYGQPTNAGAVTMQALDASQIGYVGNAAGINSINGTVMGVHAVEILQDSVYRVYGWCYRVDGLVPGVIPEQVPVSSNNTVITWFFAFAKYDHGNWIKMCEPTNITKPSFVCH